jgi:hypothetical protein
VDGAASFATFVFSVSWASLSRTNWTFAPLFFTLTVIFSVSFSLSFTHKIGCDVQRFNQMRVKTHPLFLSVACGALQQKGWLQQKAS